MADGIIEFLEPLVHLSQVCHHQSYLGLCAPTFCFLVLLLTDLGFQCSPVQVLFVVRLGAAGRNEHIEDVLFLCGLVFYGVVVEQSLTDGDGGVLTLLHKRLTEDLGTDELTAIVADVA